MSYAYTTDELITDVQGRAMLASSSNTLATADYLRFINDEIQTYITPFVLSLREEFFVTSKDVSVTAGTSSYAIPTRAIGAKLRDVKLLSGSDYIPLVRLEPETVARSPQSTTGQPMGYYLEQNNVVLYPTPGASTTLRLAYFIRPNRCVSLADTGTLSTVGATTVVISGSVPSGWGTSAANYDFVNSTPHFECRAIDKSATRSSTTFTLSAVPSNVAVGDYIALAGETPVPQIPVELHPLLAERVAVRALQALGDPKVEIAMASADRMKKSAETLLTPRSEGSSRYAINYNAPGWRRGSRYWRL